MKIIDLEWLEGHWQPVQSAILAEAGLLILPSAGLRRVS